MNKDPNFDPAIFESLKSRVLALPRRSNGAPVKTDKVLKSDILLAFKQSGMDPGEFAVKIGVSPASIRAWSGTKNSHNQNKKFSKVFKKIVVSAPTSESNPFSIGLTVEGPSGLKIVGMSTVQVAELWRKLC